MAVAQTARKRWKAVLIESLRWLLTLAAASWLIGCRVAALVSPAQKPLLAFLPFTTAAAAILNLLLLLFLIFRRHWLRAALPLIALLAAFPAINAVFGNPLRWPAESLAARPQIKVLLWNVHGLGIYDLPEDKAVPRKMLQFIKEQDPDVVCLVEFYTEKKDALKPHSQSFLQEGGFRDFRFVWDNTLGAKIYVGIGLFSKLPVSAVEERWIAQNINLLQSDISLDSATKIRIVTLHLESVGLGDKDKDIIDAAGQTLPAAKNSVRTASRFMQQTITHFRKRSRQADSVAGILAESPYPLIVCGDLNDVPGSYAYNTVRGDRGDAFADYGKPFGRTYNRLSPTLRIDNIFYDKDAFQCVDFKTFRTTLSDHNPVVATFELKPTNR